MSIGAFSASGEAGPAGDRLNDLLIQAGRPALSGDVLERFETFLALILRWNTRINLTSIRDEAGILSRHFVESIVCAHAVPAGTRTLLDFGSGGGFPGIPIMLCRPEIVVTLAESQTKKAAFLREVIRTLNVGGSVHAARAETLSGSFDCVAMRAVDRMHRAVPVAARLVSPGGSLVLMTTGAESAALKADAGPVFTWNPPMGLPFGSERLIDVGRRISAPSVLPADSL